MGRDGNQGTSRREWGCRWGPVTPVFLNETGGTGTRGYLPHPNRETTERKRAGQKGEGTDF